MIQREDYHTHKRFLWLIVTVGFIVRVAALGHVPPGLNSDELLKAFDGASVYHTGMDHHGDLLPVFFKQSGEYSPPLYIYFSGLFSWLFGINPYTVRLPSVLLGTLSIWLTFGFVRAFSNSKTALLAAAFVALSPWNIFYSRLGWEAILQIPIQLAALWLFMVWNRSGRVVHLALSTLFFALTFYTYPTEKLFTPLLLIGLVFFYYKTVLQRIRQVFLCAALFVIILVPMLWLMSQQYEMMQARWMFLSVFQRPDGWQVFIRHYLLHLSPVFLFINGAHHGMAGGVALFALMPFFFAGLVAILRGRKPEHLLLLWWLLIFAIPSSMTYDRYDPYSMPNSLRSSCGMPVVEIISAVGAVYLFSLMDLKRYKTVLIAATAVIGVGNFGFVAYDYFIKYPVYNLPDSQAGFRELVVYLESQKENYDKIIVSNKVGLHPIHLAAFSDRSPAPFSGRDFPKYVLPFYHYVPIYRDFGHQEYERHGTASRWYFQGGGRLLIAAKAGEISDAAPIHTIRYWNGEPAFEIYSKN